VILLLLAALLFGIGIAVHLLWIVAVIALAIWLLGFLVGARRKRRWYSW
jgi:uncharacterized membrane protein